MKQDKIRYGVVGLGHIAQTAVLPAFKHAKKNSELAALISEDEEKLNKLSKMYNVEHCYLLDEIEVCFSNNIIDALYIATPNDKHSALVKLAARYGIHVLCEKPMAVTAVECEQMASAAESNDIKLMIAYRLHFEPANLEVVKLCEKGTIGELKFFNSTFSYQVLPDNIRTNPTQLGGGPLYDIGIYCINASRYIFRDEPIEVMAFKASSADSRFDHSEESASVIMRFPKERLASFTVSFGSFESSDYDVIGTEGRICLQGAYEYTEPMTMTVYQKGKVKDIKTKIKKFKKRDQFAPELIYFSECILQNKTPEPGPLEGLIDVKILEAIHKSTRLKKPVQIELTEKSERPSKKQVIKRPAAKKGKSVNVRAPHK